MNSADQILHVPLDLPRFQPDCWQRFWQVWATDAVQWRRRRPDRGGNDSPAPGWLGFVWDFNQPGDTDVYDQYHTHVADYSDQFPQWRAAMEQQFPFRIRRICFVSNYQPIVPHRDSHLLTDHLPYPAAVRILLVDENTRPSFYLYSLQGSTWNRFPVQLPRETNSFAFNNPRLLHSASYHGCRKILLLVIADQFDEQQWRALLLRSQARWPEHTLISQTGP